MSLNNISDFRLTEVKDVRELIKKDILKSKRIISFIEVLEIILLLTSLIVSSLSAILKDQPEVTILAASFFNGLTIAIKLRQSKEEKKILTLKHTKKNLNIKIIKALDDDKIDHEDFERIIDMTDGEKTS